MGMATHRLRGHKIFDAIENVSTGPDSGYFNYLKVCSCGHVWIEQNDGTWERLYRDQDLSNERSGTSATSRSRRRSREK